MRRYHHELLAAGHPLSGAIAGAHGFWTVLQSSPAPMARMVEQEHEIGDMLFGVLAEETGDDVEQVRRDQVAVIDRAFDVLEQGIGPRGEQLHSDG